MAVGNLTETSPRCSSGVGGSCGEWAAAAIQPQRKNGADGRCWSENVVNRAGAWHANFRHTEGKETF